MKATGALATTVVETIVTYLPEPVSPTSASMCAFPALSVNRAQVAVRLDGDEKFSAVVVVMFANVRVPAGVSVAHVVVLDDGASTSKICVVIPDSGFAGLVPS